MKRSTLQLLGQSLASKIEDRLEDTALEGDYEVQGWATGSLQVVRVEFDDDANVEYAADYSPQFLRIMDDGKLSVTDSEGFTDKHSSLPDTSLLGEDLDVSDAVTRMVDAALVMDGYVTA